MRDGWAYDVRVLNFPRNGLYADFSARITFLNCTVKGAQDKGGDGYGYGFLEGASQNLLYRNCHGEDARHNFISSRSLTSTIVYNRCVSVNAADPDDTHYAFEQAILWDKHTQLNGEGLESFNRGDESNGAYETVASGVIWNFFGDGIPGSVPHGGAIYVKPSPDGEAIVIGVTGNHQIFDNSKGNTVKPFVAGDLMPAAAGLQVGTGIGALGNVLYEGLYQPGLEPESLYEAQLQNRTGLGPAGFRQFAGPFCRKPVGQRPGLSTQRNLTHRIQIMERTERYQMLPFQSFFGVGNRKDGQQVWRSFRRKATSTMRINRAAYGK